MGLRGFLHAKKAHMAQLLSNKYVFLAMSRCMPRPSLRFDLHLTEHCNLNCAGCTHFSPLAEPEFLDLEEARRDFARLSELFDGRVGEIHLLGGEPLLHPDLIKFMEMARSYFPTASIAILTNGLKLPNQPEEFWLACNENRIDIRATKYPIKLDYGKIEETARKYQVYYDYFNEGEPTRSLMKWGMDLKGRQNANMRFLECFMANSCIQLVHGRLYTCCTAAYIHHFNRQFNTRIDESPDNFIDIYKAGSKEEILAFLAKPIPLCSYCRGTVQENIPWHQSQKEISEWT